MARRKWINEDGSLTRDFHRATRSGFYRWLFGTWLGLLVLMAAGWLIGALVTWSAIVGAVFLWGGTG